MKDSVTFKVGTLEIDSIKLKDIECTYNLEGTKEEYSEIVDKLVAATMLFMDKINGINNNNKETK
jgi:hypothetical protein